MRVEGQLYKLVSEVKEQFKGNILKSRVIINIYIHITQYTYIGT